MSGIVTVICAGALIMLAEPTPARNPADVWRQIRVIAEQSGDCNDPQLVDYLKSLKPSEMLAAARHACKETGEEFKHVPDGNRSVLAAKNALLCISHVFDHFESVDAGGDVLITVAANKSEPPCLRLVVIAGLKGGIGGRFPFLLQNLDSYATAHEVSVAELLDRITNDKDDDLFVRIEAIRTYSTRLRDKGRSICMSDPSAIALSGGSKIPLPLGELARSGELRLREEAWQALAPIEERAVAHASELVKIALDPKEPEDLREHARQTIKQYQQIPMKDDGMISSILSKLQADAP